ncbi:hypothetical protein DP73_04920 [Desulfosporosinus sp. HMP52]|uniref:hypothetical protein n=1 Tax=Desulfosporosinus sp. HMP52 TaxID=1487923 RepID=UPI00051FCDB1|nr:hypothetical protein [Desulfosporosinus sp. HMP52]KGK91183.1 hypothetical protein DP73_04920 [Desulfosporosinus sp. HMP52]
MNNRLGKDTLLIGAVSGIAAKLIQDLLGAIIIMFFLPSYLNCVRIAGGLLLLPEQVLSGRFWPTLLGLQIDMVVGIVVAIVAVLIFQHWGNDYYKIKGVMVGLIAWVLLYSTLSRFLSSVHPSGSILQAELSFLTHIIFGLSLSWCIIWLRKFKNSNSHEI